MSFPVVSRSVAPRNWGPPPGELNTDGRDMLIYGTSELREAFKKLGASRASQLGSRCCALALDAMSLKYKCCHVCVSGLVENRDLCEPF